MRMYGSQWGSFNCSCTQFIKSHMLCTGNNTDGNKLMIFFSTAFYYGVTCIIIYLFSVNTFTPIERCAIIFVIAQVGKILIGQKIQKLQNRARCNRSLIGQ